MDEDLKDSLRAAAKKRKSSASLIARVFIGSAIPDLDVSHMPAYQLACWKVFDDPKLILGIAHDAARFGFPQEETMLYAFTNGIVGAWGFPMVPYIHIFTN